MSITATNNPYPTEPDASPTKLDRGGYEGNAQTLDEKIDSTLNEAKSLIGSVLAGSQIINGVTVSSSIPATGNIHTFVAAPGTYVNWNNLVVEVNKIAILMRIDGVYSVSQTPLIIPDTKIKPFVNQDYSIDSQVSSLGKFWYNTAATSIGEIPGTSPKWVDLLSGYLSQKSIKTSVGTSVADTMSQYAVTKELYDVVISPNLFDKSVITSSTYVTGATLNSNANFFTTDFIACSSGVLQKANKPFTFISFYTTKDLASFISGSYIGVANQTVITPPANAAFYRLSPENFSQTQINEFQIEIGSVSTVYQSFGLTSYLSKLSKVITDANNSIATVLSDANAHTNTELSKLSLTNDILVNANKFNPFTVSPKTYVAAGVANATANASFFSSDFIPCKTGVVEYVNGLGYTWASFYTSNNMGSYIAGSGTGVAGQKTITPPANAKFYRLGFENRSIYDIKIEVGSVSTPYTRFDRFVDKLDDIFIKQNGYKKGSFTSGSEFNTTAYTDFTDGRWITNSNNNDLLEGTVKTIKIDVQQAGNVTIGIGRLDQNNITYIDSTTVVNCPIAGKNSIAVNLNLIKGNRLFVKAPVKLGYADIGSHLEAAAASAVNTTVANELYFSYVVEGKLYYTKEISSILELASVTNEVNDLASKVGSAVLNNGYMTSPNKLWQLSVNDSGVISTVEVQSKKIAVIGNSLDHHPITEIWWGEWGMAATKRENDWKNQLCSMLRANGVPSSVKGNYAAAWEISPTTYNYALLDATLDIDTDLTIIRIGENISGDLTNLQANTTTLINYVQSRLPNKPIIIGGQFWLSAPKRVAMKAAADAKGLPYVDFDLTQIGDTQAGLGTKVYGDDLQWHTINNPAVGVHLNDKAMKEIAKQFLPTALSILQ